VLRGLSLPLHKELQVPDQNVDVTFDPTATPQFTFDCDAVRMTEAGKIILHRKPATAKWKFTDGSVKADPLNQFSFEPLGNGRLLVINDRCEDPPEEGAKPYCYTVTVELDGAPVTSPDPVIVNDPGARLEEQS
jgi:hypothetical protein